MKPSPGELRRAIAVLAHELRNPLSVFRAGVDLLPSDDPQQARLRDVLMRQTVHMTKLVEDLSDISRAELGKLRIDRRPVRFQNIVEETVECFRRKLKARRQLLDVRIPKEPLWINGDSIRLEQVISNLLSNASKYSDPGSRIELSVTNDDGQASLSVRDFGIGIASDDLSQIFEFLSQCELQEAIDHREGGLGIGLALARQIVGQHDGSITAHSDGLGKGSEFSVRFPLIHVDEPTHIETQKMRVFQSLRVLVIDDNLGSQYMLPKLIGRLGRHEVEVASSGEEAIGVLNDFVPDLILLDLGLPDMSGIELARQIRADASLPRTIIVALTGYEEEEVQRAASEAGVDGYRIKPVSIEMLRGIFEEFGERFFSQVEPVVASE